MHKERMRRGESLPAAMIESVFVANREGQTKRKPRNHWLNSDKELIYLSTVS